MSCDDGPHLSIPACAHVMSAHFYASASVDRGHIVFGPSVRLFVRKSVTLAIFLLLRVRAFICHMSIPCDKNFLFVPSSRSSVKVKVEFQGHNLQKMAVAGHWRFTNTSCFCLCLSVCLCVPVYLFVSPA